MRKLLFYVMQGEKMCFMHALLNADSLIKSGHEVKIIMEGKSVKLPKVFEDEKNKLYKKLLDNKTIVGVCKACSKVLGVYEENEKLGLNLLDDMNGHAGMKDYVENEYEVIVF